MEPTSRREVLGAAGTAALAGVAGCTSSGPGKLNVWIRNDLDEEIDYEIEAGGFAEEGTLDGGGLDTFEDVIAHPGVGESVEMSFRFGLRAGEEFVETASGSDTIEIGDETASIFARNTEMRVVYGASDDAGLSDDD